ncbi:non-ribosomal peptide synthetase, partial [Agrobacterium vitis]|uniref:condensation domain-containing protein n=2 Tax=Rhizobium/Agrobacterium group TaxID=227290 RepID=UPI001328D80C
GAVEETLAAIWADLLRVERVGRHDNFFELGGHSLLAIQIIARMRREGLQCDIRALFETPTLEGLAATVGAGTGEVDVPPNLIPDGCQRITPDLLPLIDLTQAEIDGIAAQVPGGAANIQDIYPLGPLQEGVLFHHLMGGEGDVYLVSGMLAFDSRDRLQGFLVALEAAIARHDILRTGFAWEGLDQPVQIVWRQAPLRVEEVELDADGGDAAQQLQQRFDPRRTRLDLGQAPLLRVFIARDEVGDRWLARLLHHHLVMDHTALAILADEVLSHPSGEVSQAPAPIPFRRFVAQARLGVKTTEHEAFFRDMLGDVSEPTAPFGLADVHLDGSGLEEARLALEPELAGRLRRT